MDYRSRVILDDPIVINDKPMKFRSHELILEEEMRCTRCGRIIPPNTDYYELVGRNTIWDQVCMDSWNELIKSNPSEKEVYQFVHGIE